MRFITLPVMALAAVTITACVTPIPEHVALDPAARASIDSTEVVAPVRQSEIYVFVPAATAGQANGLIGALIDAGIDAHRAKTAGDSVKPLRVALVDYNFDQKLQGDLQTSLGINGVAEGRRRARDEGRHRGQPELGRHRFQTK